MKYARKQDYDGELRIVDVVEIPNPLPEWAKNADAFLAKIFPMHSGWFLLTDDVGNGAVQKQNGKFEQPIVAATMAALSEKQILDAKLQAIADHLGVDLDAAVAEARGQK